MPDKIADLHSWVERHFLVERWRGEEADIRCRLHDDAHASAGINAAKRVWKCQACGAGGKLSDLARELGLDDLPAYGDNRQGQRETARFDYQDAGGRVVYQMVRFEPGKHGRPKDFAAYNPATDEWSIKGIERVPYRMPELLVGIKEGKEIWIAEGEKDVETLRKHDLVATCNQEGVGSADLWETLSKHFPAGTEVVLCPDADQPGQRLMFKVAHELSKVGCRVRVIDFGFAPLKDHGQDVSDWFAAGHTKDELIRLAGRAALSQAEEQEEENEADAGIPVKDYGHATMLAQRLAGRYRWAPHRACWMEWNGQVWRPTEEERVSKVSADVLRKTYAEQLAATSEKTSIGRLTALIHETCIFARIIGALSFLKGWDGIITRTEEWDADPWILNVANGIVDLRTGVLQAHDSEKLLTKLAPVNFDPTASGPAWQAHLERFLPNENIRRQVQRDLGMALVGADIEEMLPIWYGTGGNGKTTTDMVLHKILDDYVMEAAPNLLIQSKYERHLTEIAELAGRRLVFSSEVGQGKKLDEALVKRLTGGERKRGHFMRQDNFEFEQTFTIFMIVNHHPEISGTDHSIWRRVRMIPWTAQIPVADQQPQDEVVARLAREGSAVLAWLLAGLADWHKDKTWMAPEVRAASAAYRAEQDRLGAFLAEMCEEATHYTVRVSDLYAKYAEWCIEVGEDPTGKTDFGAKLRDRGKMTKKSGHEHVSTWFGLRLKRDVRTCAYSVSNSPLETDSMLEEQGNKYARVRSPENVPNGAEMDTLTAKARQFSDGEEEKAETERQKPPAGEVGPAEGQKTRSGDPWDECAESVPPAAEKGTEHPEQEEIF